MSEYHLSLKVGAKGKASPHYNYICATGKYAAKCGVVHVEHGNMPQWASAHPSLFWEASDEFERANGTVYRELEIALPRELPLSSQLELVRELAVKVCGQQHAYSFAIHHTKASDGGLNPHVHLQFSERIDDGIDRDPKQYFKRANKTAPEKGGCVKDRSWQATNENKNSKTGYRAKSSDRLLEIRQVWAEMCNQALETHGVDDRIDHRSLKDQDIDRVPQPKVGARSWHLFQRTGEKNERYKRWEQVVASNNAIVITTATKSTMLEKLADAEQRYSSTSRRLAALPSIRRPNKSNILRGIVESQQHVRRLAKEAWQLEHITRHTAYDAMMQTKWKRDGGKNWLSRAWNRFYFGGDYNRLKDEYKEVLTTIKSKTREREKLIERLSKHPHAIKQCSIQYAEQANEYNAYINHKAELETELQLAKQEMETCRRALPQPTVQRQHDQSLHLSLRM